MLWPASRSRPRAPACSTCARTSTAGRCAACSMRPAAPTEMIVLGYREATARTSSVCCRSARPVLGHKMHQTVVTPRAGATPAWSWPGGPPEGFVWRSVSRLLPQPALGRQPGDRVAVRLRAAGQPAGAVRLVPVAPAPVSPPRRRRSSRSRRPASTGPRCRRPLPRRRVRRRHRPRSRRPPSVLRPASVPESTTSRPRPRTPCASRPPLRPTASRRRSAGDALPSRLQHPRSRRPRHVAEPAAAAVGAVGPRSAGACGLSRRRRVGLRRRRRAGLRRVGAGARGGSPAMRCVGGGRVRRRVVCRSQDRPSGRCVTSRRRRPRSSADRPATRCRAGGRRATATAPADVESRVADGGRRRSRRIGAAEADADHRADAELGAHRAAHRAAVTRATMPTELVGRPPGRSAPRAGRRPVGRPRGGRRTRRRRPPSVELVGGAAAVPVAER